MYQDILSAVTTALNAVKIVATMPGVSTLPYVSTIASVTSALAEAVEFGEQKVRPYVDALLDTFGDGATPPTPEQLAALDARIAELRAQLHAPLPPAEAGEPE